MILVWLAALAASLQDDTTTLTLTFDKMHCDECKAELEATLKKVPGYKSAQISDGTVSLALEEKAALPALNRLPKDLVLKSVTARVRGTVVFSGEKASLIVKGSGATLALSNPETPGADPLGELKKKLGGKNRFTLTGLLVGGKTIVLAASAPAEWKD